MILRNSINRHNRIITFKVYWFIGSFKKLWKFFCKNLFKSVLSINLKRLFIKLFISFNKFENTSKSLKISLISNIRCNFIINISSYNPFKNFILILKLIIKSGPHKAWFRCNHFNSDFFKIFLLQQTLERISNQFICKSFGIHMSPPGDILHYFYNNCKFYQLI